MSARVAFGGRRDTAEVVHVGTGGRKSNCMGKETFEFPRRTGTLWLALLKTPAPRAGRMSNLFAAPHCPRESTRANPTYPGSIAPAVLAIDAQSAGRMCGLETLPLCERNTSMSTLPALQTVRDTVPWASRGKE